MAENQDILISETSIKEVDILRDTPVRLLGYTNELGEAFRAQISKWSVRATYGIASSYVIADAIDKGKKASKSPNLSSRDKRDSVLLAVGDTIVWQGLASVLIPGATINRLCWASRRFLSSVVYTAGRSPRLPPINWVVSVVGLAAIPFIVHPIDSMVTWGMESFVRPHYRLDPLSTKAR